MSQFDEYPYKQFREAMGTMFGRLDLIFLAVLGGSMLGGWTGLGSIAGIFLGSIGLFGLAPLSIFSGVGLFVFPLLVFYAIASIRAEWPLRLTWLCLFLMWWNIDMTVRWAVYDSPMLKEQRKLQAEFQEVIKQAQENESK
jgi:hypothetical protein